MSEINYRNVKISDIFEYKTGNPKYTKQYCNENKGIYEVFSGTTIGSFGFINTYNYDQELLTFTTKGKYAGTLKVLNGKFSIGADRAILIPIEKNILPHYLVYALQTHFCKKVRKENVPSLTWNTIKNTVIKIPSDKDGNLNLEIQERLTKKYKSLDDFRKELLQKMNVVKDVQIEFLTMLWKNKSYKITDLFDIKTGNNKYTKKFILENSGKYPIYSGKTTGPYGFINSYDFNGNYLSWTSCGLAGYLMIHENEKFSITSSRCILSLKKNIKNVNLKYIKIVLEPIFRKHKTGRLAINEKNEYTHLTKEMIEKDNLKIILPVTECNEIDLEKQNQIVQKYEIFNKLKRKIWELLKTISEIEIDFF